MAHDLLDLGQGYVLFHRDTAKGMPELVGCEVYTCGLPELLKDALNGAFGRGVAIIIAPILRRCMFFNHL